MKRLYFMILLATTTSCGKFLDDYSQDLVIPKSVQDFDELLLGNGYLPNKEVSDLRNGGLMWWTLILDDDINTVMEQVAVRSFDMDKHYYGYTTWQLEIGRSFSGADLRPDHQTWEELYQRVNAMNIILTEIDQVSQEKEADRLAANRIKGEALFLRAQFYFALVNLYGPMYAPKSAESTLGVPIKLTSYVEHDNQKEAQFKRASVEVVYGQIVKDLKQSIAYLSHVKQAKKHRVSDVVAQLLLSRVYLYMQNWEQAAALSREVIQTHGLLHAYSGIGEVDAVITVDNPEILFAQGPLNQQNAITARGGDFCISNDLYSSYADDDYRKELYFRREAFTDSIAINRKFKQGLQISAVSDLFLYRTAEAYLNQAEALAMLGKTNEAQALLNRFRSYRMQNIPSESGNAEALVHSIREERRKEFCLEGHRWFDLRRYAVDEKYPFKKEIVRSYAVYDWDNKNRPIRRELYKLNQDDAAYTFSIPKSVLEFDRTIPDNPREIRKAIEEIPYN